MKESTSKTEEKSMLDTVAALQAEVEELRTELQQGKPAAIQTEIEQQIELLVDPYETQRPYKILKDLPPDADHPEGLVLRWISPRYRGVRGLRGWRYMQWDDEKYFGEDCKNMSEFLADPPDNVSQTDNYIRRADVILGCLDKRIFTSRQVKRELESARRRGLLETPDEVKPLMKGVRIEGPGMQKDKEPKKEIGRISSENPYYKSTEEGTHRTELMSEKEEDLNE